MLMFNPFKLSKRLPDCDKCTQTTIVPFIMQTLEYDQTGSEKSKMAASKHQNTYISARTQDSNEITTES